MIAQKNDVYVQPNNVTYNLILPICSQKDQVSRNDMKRRALNLAVEKISHFQEANDIHLSYLFFIRDVGNLSSAENAFSHHSRQSKIVVKMTTSMIDF